GGDPQLSLAPDHHEGNALVPARDDLAGAELEGEGLAAPAAVKLRTVLQPAGVVDHDHVAARGLFTGTLLQVVVLQSRWGGRHAVLLIIDSLVKFPSGRMRLRCPSAARLP